MGGALLQLVAYGAQDVYLTGNPQITYFKVVYRRHTNFSMECIEQTFNGTPGAEKKVSCTITRNGDLIGAMHIKLLTSGATFTEFVDIIKDVEIEIGGQKIDKHYGKWFDIWHELTVSHMYGPKYHRDHLIPETSGTSQYVPLHFWFNRNIGCALPLIALQYHEVKINITFGDGGISSLANYDFSTAKLWVDYIYLDDDERKRFAKMSHEYLIEQLQYSDIQTLPGSNKKGTIPLSFNHPIKEVIWQPNTTLGGEDANIKLTFNGNDRFESREERYFTVLQKYYHHSYIASSVKAKRTGVYSFALRPEEHQPSGTCNFSRIDKVELSIGNVGNATSIEIYAINYNILRVMSGMGGLAYSN